MYSNRPAFPLSSPGIWVSVLTTPSFPVSGVWTPFSAAISRMKLAELCPASALSALPTGREFTSALPSALKALDTATPAPPTPVTPAISAAMLVAAEIAPGLAMAAMPTSTRTGAAIAAVTAIATGRIGSYTAPLRASMSSRCCSTKRSDACRPSGSVNVYGFPFAYR